jgi:hypothetical protein
VDYFAVKLVHQSAVALSLTGFIVRGGASLSGARWVNRRMAKTLPHIIDSVLLLSALALAWMLRLTPMNSPWLLAKIVGWSLCRTGRRSVASRAFGGGSRNRLDCSPRDRRMVVSVAMTKVFSASLEAWPTY